MMVLVGIVASIWFLAVAISVIAGMAIGVIKHKGFPNDETCNS
jgi:hypothetical protein